MIDLLVAMGYRGTEIDAAQAIGKPGDEGIDGIIKEDPLGLDSLSDVAFASDPWSLTPQSPR